MRESKIETETCDYAKNLGWLCYKFSSPGNRSVPDRIFIRDKILFFIEFKAADKQLTKLQAHTARKISSEGFEIYVIDNLKAGIALFDRMEQYVS